MNVFDYTSGQLDLQLVDENNPALRRRASELTQHPKDKQSALALCLDMRAVMFDAGGIAICAQQVGLPYSIVTGRYDTPTQRLWDFNAMNLRLFPSYSRRTIKSKESCLSFPGFARPIERPAEIGYMYFCLNRDRVVAGVAEGLMARMLQHEYDHLQGKLIA